MEGKWPRHSEKTMTHRTGQTVWVLVLSDETRPQFEGCKDLVCALSGRRGLITDFGLHETVAFLDREGMLDAFHFVVDRGGGRGSDPGFLTGAGRRMGVLRRHRVVYVDAHAGACVAAKLLGWRACLLSGGRSALKSAGAAVDARAGMGAWYDQRFNTLRNALRYYIFGT